MEIHRNELSKGAPRLNMKKLTAELYALAIRDQDFESGETDAWLASHGSSDNDIMRDVGVQQPLLSEGFAFNPTRCRPSVGRQPYFVYNFSYGVRLNDARLPDHLIEDQAGIINEADRDTNYGQIERKVQFTYNTDTEVLEASEHYAYESHDSYIEHKVSDLDDERDLDEVRVPVYSDEEEEMNEDDSQFLIDAAQRRERVSVTSAEEAAHQWTGEELLRDISAELDQQRRDDYVAIALASLRAIRDRL